MWKNHSQIPSTKHLHFIATYSVRGQVVKLDKYCGDVWNMHGQADHDYNKTVFDRVAEAQEKVRETVEKNNHELRSGVLREAEA